MKKEPTEKKQTGLLNAYIESAGVVEKEPIT